MRQHLITLLTVCAMALPAVASAQTLKIGVVDLQRAMVEVGEGKAARSRLESRFKTSQQRLDKEQEALKKRMDDLEKKSLAMDEETLRKQRTEIQQEMMRVTNLYTQLQKELRDEEQKATQDIVGKLRGLIRTLADNKGFAYVLEKNESGLLHWPAANDFTDDLIRAYDAKFAGSSKK